MMRVKIKNITVILTAAVLAVFFPSYVNAGVGSTGAEFLLIESGARAAAMGGAQTAFKSGLGSVPVNPASMAAMRSPGFSATHAEWLSDIRYETVGYGCPVSFLGGGFGINAIYLHMGDIEGRSANGRKTDDFSAYDMAVNLSFGTGMGRGVSAGASVKFIRQAIEDESASGVALDLGGLYEVKNTELVLGAAVYNLGPGMKFVKETYSLPLTVSVGSAYRYGFVMFGADIKYRLKGGLSSLSLGAEYSPFGFLTIRGGYLLDIFSKLSDRKDLGSSTDFTGLGAGFGIGLEGYLLDYAFSPFADLGNTRRLSISGRF